VGEFPPLWTEWNGKYRDTVRSFWAGEKTGVRDLGYRLTGSSDLYADDGRRPFASINFVTCHDGFTLRDLTTYERKRNDANLEDNRDGTDDNRSWNCGVEGESDDEQVNRLRRRQARNLLATLLLSTGVPMLLAGDELRRTQQGNNNAYCQDNPMSYVDWSLVDSRDGAAMRRFVAALLRLRAGAPVLRQRAFFEGRQVAGGDGCKDLAWFRADGTEMRVEDWFDAQTGTIGMYLDGRGLLLVLHAGNLDCAFTLPGEPWAASYQVVVDTSYEEGPPAGLAPYPAGLDLPVRARSVVLLRVRR